MTLASARRRRVLGLLLCLTPTVGVVVFDLSVRAREIAAGGRLAPYVAGVLLSLLVWGSLVRAASRSRGVVPVIAATSALLLAAAAGLTQATAYGQFRAYADPFAMSMGIGLLGTVVDPMGAQLPRALSATALFAGLAVVVLALVRCNARTKVRESRICLILAAVSLATQVVALPLLDIPSQGAPPDVLFVAAIGKALMVGPAPEPQKAREIDWSVARRRPSPLPVIVPYDGESGHAPRNVLLILTESVRADAVCSAPVPICPTTPATNALLPHRLPLLGMHASATFTAVSFASITSGLLGTASADAYLQAPLLWDYANAAGLDTGYFSAQHAAFAGAGEWLSQTHIRRHVHAQTIDSDAPQIPGADDRLLLRRAAKELAQLRTPYLAVVHLASTHYPYVVDPAQAPFQPMSRESSGRTAPGLHNRYRNSVFMQDAAIARFISDFRQTEAGRHTVIVFTSDHGESFFEHGVGLHGSTLFEEERHVPAWLDAPDGVLDASERTSLARVRDVPTMNVDLLPTMLDLLGIWRSPALAPYRARQDGRSLLSAEAVAPRTVVTTNCSSIWRCGLPLWIATRDRRKLIDRVGVRSCFDIQADPHEMAPLALEACGDLAGPLTDALAKGTALR